MFPIADDNPVSPPAIGVPPDEDPDDEWPDHFECGQHYLWWLQHHPHHGSRPKRPLFKGPPVTTSAPDTIPIEIFGLPLMGGGFGTSGGREFPEGGCPGLPDYRRWQDFPSPISPPAPVPDPALTGSAPVKPPYRPPAVAVKRCKDDETIIGVEEIIEKAGADTVGTYRAQGGRPVAWIVHHYQRVLIITKRVRRCTGPDGWMEEHIEQERRVVGTFTTREYVGVH